MKKLYIIGGTMGVGKTTTCRLLQKKLDRSVFLDGDWCWDASPFAVTDETKAMVVDNICYMLNNFLRCSAYDNVIFCWVMHEQWIIDSITERLDTSECEVKTVSLICGEEALRERLGKDVAAGVREAEGTERSVARMGYYLAASMRTTKVDTTGKTAEQVADEIARM